MSELVAAQVDDAWWWVTAGYIVVLGGILVFAVRLGVRTRRVRRSLDRLP